MAGTEFKFDDDSRGSDVAGTPEGDGDFESDDLPSTGETSSGGQVTPAENTREGLQGGRKPESLLEKVIDEISTGKILP